MDARRGWLDWLVLAALVMAWGSAFAALKIAVRDIDPLWNTFIRLAIAAVVVGAVMAVQRTRLPPLRPKPHASWGWYAFAGVVGTALPLLLYAYAVVTLPSAVAAICNGATPIFVAVAGHFLTGDRLTVRRSLGVAMGFTGLVVLVGGGVVRELDVGHLGGLAAALSGAALYAASNTAIRKSPPLPAAVGAFILCAMGAAVAILPAMALAAAPVDASAQAWLAAIFLGVGPTALATIGYVWLIQRRGPLFAVMGTYLSPLWATVVGITLMGERPHAEAFAALVLIVGGVMVANLRPRPAAVPAEPPAA